MKIVFFGLPLAALLLLADGHELLSAMLTPLPHPGRRRLLRSAGGARIVDALALGDAFAGEVDEAMLARADLIVSWFWTRRLPERWLVLPRLGAIGAHPSLLPRHRGPDPFFWAIDSAVARRCGLGESSATLILAEVSMILHECQVGCVAVRRPYLPL